MEPPNFWLCNVNTERGSDTIRSRSFTVSATLYLGQGCAAVHCFLYSDIFDSEDWLGEVQV